MLWWKSRVKNKVLLCILHRQLRMVTFIASVALHLTVITTYYVIYSSEIYLVEPFSELNILFVYDVFNQSFSFYYA